MLVVALVLVVVLVAAGMASGLLSAASVLGRAAATIGMTTVIVGGVAVIGVLAVTVLAFGLRGPGGDTDTAPVFDDTTTGEPARDGEGRASDEHRSEPTTGDTGASASSPVDDRLADLLGPIVGLTAESTDADGGQAFADPPGVVDELRTGDVLRLSIRGFEPHTQLLIEQCQDAGDRERCENRISAYTGERGDARLEYLVLPEIDGDATSGCSPGDPPCRLVVRSGEGDRTAHVVTVFGASASPPGSISVSPTSGLRDGDSVAVTARGFRPGTRLRVALCAAPGGPERCGDPGPHSDMVVIDDGTATTTLTVSRAPLGSSRVTCGGELACGVAVIGPGTSTAARVVPVSFRSLVGPDYSAGRLVIGLVVAAGLLLAAVALVRGTDWSPVGEARAPEIDEAEYADLDAIVATLPRAESLDDLIEASHGRGTR